MSFLRLVLCSPDVVYRNEGGKQESKVVKNMARLYR